MSFNFRRHFLELMAICRALSLIDRACPFHSLVRWDLEEKNSCETFNFQLDLQKHGLDRVQPSWNVNFTLYRVAVFRYLASRKINNLTL